MTRHVIDIPEAESARTRAVVERFLDAFGRSDVDAVMEVMSDDCVFESTEPPDGRRHQGREVVRRCWEELFRTPGAHFATEEVVSSGDRAVVRWRYSWTGDSSGHVRGVDLITVRDGEVVEKLSYVTGRQVAVLGDIDGLPPRGGSRRQLLFLGDLRRRAGRVAWRS